MKLHVIYYTTRTLHNAQFNCATTEKKLLAIVFFLTSFDLILYVPFSNQVFASQERCQTTFDSVGIIASRS